jgi:hypothetical protein
MQLAGLLSNDLGPGYFVAVLAVGLAAFVVWLALRP